MNELAERMLARIAHQSKQIAEQAKRDQVQGREDREASRSSWRA